MTGAGFQPQQFGKYVLTERIGAGGMAEIFRATAFGVEGFTKQVCIKRILPTLTSDETFIRMFVDEAKIAVNLHHANIVQVFDLGRIGEHYFIAMELVAGRDLLAIINRCRKLRRRLPAPLVLQIIAEVCRGLDYAHRCKVEGRPAGIIHRDVSPSNILVSWEGDVKVADFGIAKAAHKEQKTATGTLKGKYGYMSPEQVQGQPIDHRSDIFAAGVLLWESLVARRLFKGETDLETLEMVRAARVPQLPSQLNKAIPQRVDGIVKRALALHPQDRYQTAAEMAGDLADALYEMGQRADAGRLAAFMKEIFAREIADEERRERDRSSPSLPALPPQMGPPTPTGPATRLDLPPGASPQPPARRGLSPLALGVIGSGLIILAGAVVVLVYWLANRPQPAPAPLDAGITVPRPPPVAKKKAVLLVDSRPPGAAVYLDGQATWKRTPARLEGLAGGRHRVRLELEGYRSWSRQVDLEEAEKMALEAEMVRRPRRPPVRPAVKTGTLNVNAVPVWAWVYIDGHKQPRPTPLYNIKLKAGRHRIRLENPRLKLSVTRQVNILPGKKLNLVVEMKK